MSDLNEEDQINEPVVTEPSSETELELSPEKDEVVPLPEGASVEVNDPMPGKVAEESIESAALPEDLSELNKGCVNMGPEDLEVLTVKLKEGLELSKADKNHARSQDIRELIWKVNDLRALGVRGIKQLENKSQYQHQKDMRKNKYNKKQQKWQQPEAWRDNLPIPGGAEQQEDPSQKRNNRRNKSNNRRNSRTKRGFSQHRGRDDYPDEQDVDAIAKALVDRIIFDALAKLNPTERRPKKCIKLNSNAKDFVPSPKKMKPRRTQLNELPSHQYKASAIELELQNLGVPQPQFTTIPQLDFDLYKANKDKILADTAMCIVNEIIAKSINIMIDINEKDKIDAALPVLKPHKKMLDIDEGPRLNLSICEAELLAAMQEDEDTCDSIYHDISGYTIKQEPNMGG